VPRSLEPERLTRVTRVYLAADAAFPFISFNDEIP